MLIKGGRVLDALTHVSTVAFDKTGTLTTGLLTCTSMLGLDSIGQTLPPSGVCCLLLSIASLCTTWGLSFSALTGLAWVLEVR